MSSDHVVSTRVYYLIFAILMVLLGATVGVYYVDLGPFGLAIAMAIALIKAALVVLIFMHLRYTAGLTAVAVVTAIGWLVLLIAMTAGDFVTRGWLPLLSS
jgi:cytochrome c oxidase subunit IV